MNANYLRMINLTVLFLLTLCALKVVHTRHTARGLNAEIGRLDKSNRQLEVEYGQLLLEQSTWGAQGRIERLAGDKFRMKHPELNQIVILERSKP